MKRISIVLLAAAVAAASNSPRVSAESGSRNYVILARSEGKGSTTLDGAVARANGTITGRQEEIGVAFASSSNPDFASQLAADARIQGVVEDVEIQWIPDAQVEAVPEGAETDAATTSVPDFWFPLQWNLKHIRADVAHNNGDQGWGVKRARVAVVDTGVYPNHIDLAANLNVALSKSFVPTEPGFAFVPPLPPPAVIFSHGTHVSGIIAAPINGIGTLGVAPRAEIVNVKVLRSSNGSGAFSWVINGIMYASGPTVQADVINMSLGAIFPRTNAGGTGLGFLISALNRAVNHATQAGTLVVSAAGNNGVDLNGNLWFVPAQSGNGMAVSALAPLGYFSPFGSTNADLLASYSNYGQSVVSVAGSGGNFAYPGNESCTVAGITRPCWVFDGVFAPGAVSGFAHYWFWAAGTSMATPHVSGVAALIVGKYGRTPPSQLKSLIQRSAVDILKPGADGGSGHGRIDAVNALQ